MNYEYFSNKWTSYIHTKWDSSKYDNAYFGPYGVSYIKNHVELSIVKSPCNFKNQNIYPSTEYGSIEKEYCCGELCGEGDFSYGTYSWKVEMPEGKHLWPALWLCGKQSWPPEIDVVEGYTDNRGDYVKNILTTRLESNFHMRKNKKSGTHINIGAKGMSTVFYKLFHKVIDEYKCVWTPEYIKLYFNGHLYRTMKDKDFLADINEAHSMYPIMNIMTDDGFVLDEKNPPILKIYDFKYKKL